MDLNIRILFLWNICFLYLLMNFFSVLFFESHFGSHLQMDTFEFSRMITIFCRIIINLQFTFTLCYNYNTLALLSWIPFFSIWTLQISLITYNWLDRNDNNWPFSFTKTVLVLAMIAQFHFFRLYMCMYGFVLKHCELKCNKSIK